jgi:heat shock protein HslJ
MKRCSIALLALLTLSGCAITSRDATTELPGTAWDLVDLDGAEPVGQTPPSLAFTEDGSVTGSTGCNTFNAEVTIDGTELTFGPLATTRMACTDDAAAQQEQAYLAALGGGHRLHDRRCGPARARGWRLAHVRGRTRGRVARHAPVRSRRPARRTSTRRGRWYDPAEEAHER